MQLAPKDEQAAKVELAAKLGIAPEQVASVRMVDWMTGEVLVSYHDNVGGTITEIMALEPAVPTKEA